MNPSITHLENIQIHDQVHQLFSDQDIKDRSPDLSYNICYPPETSNLVFRRFWNWYQSQFPTTSFSSRTQYFLNQLINSNILNRDHIARRIIFSSDILKTFLFN